MNSKSGLAEKVILVDSNDNVLGEEDKLRVHQEGLLHRAFSIFIFNRKAQLLLQRRALSKYHSKGLWTNTCCSHPRLHESILDAAKRRLKEEMGFVCELKEIYQFIYREPVGEGLIEHEYDHVLVGRFDGPVNPTPTEVMGTKWIGKTELINDAKSHPEKYTEWFKIVVNRELEKIWNSAGP